MSKFLKEYILYFYAFLSNVNDTIIIFSNKTSQHLSCRSKYKSDRIYRPKDVLYLLLFIIFVNIYLSVSHKADKYEQGSVSMEIHFLA